MKSVRPATPSTLATLAALTAFVVLGATALPGVAQTSSAAASAPPAAEAPAPTFDAELAKKLGADELGMRNYVMVILRTGPNKITDKQERADMFKGHFANMNRLAGEGKLALAGPFGDAGGDWRGLFILATGDVEQAKQWVNTDPVVAKGEMVPEFHKLYTSAALMQTTDLHRKIAKKGM